MQLAKQIDVAPKNGDFIILQDACSWELGRWAQEVNGWVQLDGTPVRISPTHWTPVSGDVAGATDLERLPFFVPAPPDDETAQTQKRPLARLILALVTAIFCIGGFVFWIGSEISSSDNSAAERERKFSQERERTYLAAAREHENVALTGASESKRIANSKQRELKQALDESEASAERRNGVARVTPQAAQQGRFAARFAARAQGANFRAGTAALAPRRAWSLGLRAAFVPWHGPVFWPYAYSDVFDYAFWPSGYDDSYFAYAYDDFFDGVFWGQVGPPPEYSYAYAPPNARLARSTSSTVEELCTQPGTGITAWPFAEIKSRVRLNPEQKQLLDQVRSSGQRAASVLKASCPAKNAFAMTPTGRLQAMTLRLTATLEAVQTVRPAMEKFYNSLRDEQKERLTEIGPKQPKNNAQANQTSAWDGKSCSEPKAGLANLPIERIEDAVKPTNAQEDGLKHLEKATAKAVSIMQAACPEDTPIAAPGRLEAMEKRLQAMIDAANTVKPALNDFYGSLSSEQKARFNRIGGELAQSSNYL